jgi:hypothetical protein
MAAMSLSRCPVRQVPARLGLAAAFRAAFVAAAAWWGISGCSPALDWRQLQPEGWSLRVDMPCRPSRLERQLPLAGQTVTLGMLSCNEAGRTYAVASADVADPARVGPALAALAAAARSNLQARVLAETEARVPGMTPYAEARAYRLSGSRPDGQVLQMQVLVFAHGTRVFQATVLGATAGDGQDQVLFDSLKIVSG